jgi:hypothetical protein
MITDVAQAIMTKFNETPGSDDLRTALSGGLFFTEAADDVAFPYAVFTWDSSTVNELAGGRLQATEIASLTFNIFTKSDDGGIAIFDIIQKFITVYDWTTLTYPAGEYTHVACERTSATNFGKIDNVWRIDLDYDIWYSH